MRAGAFFFSPSRWTFRAYWPRATFVNIIISHSIFVIDIAHSCVIQWIVDLEIESEFFFIWDKSISFFCGTVGFWYNFSNTSSYETVQSHFAPEMLYSNGILNVIGVSVTARRGRRRSGPGGRYSSAWIMLSSQLGYCTHSFAAKTSSSPFPVPVHAGAKAIVKSYCIYVLC